MCGKMILIAIFVIFFPTFGAAQADSSGKKGEIKIFQLETKDAPVLPKERKMGPMGVKSIAPKAELMAEEKLEEQIATLNELIESTDDEDPIKPEYYARLADVYWDKAENFFAKAMGDEIFRRLREAQESENEAEIKRIEEEQKLYLQQRKYWQEEAIKVYQGIVAKFPNYPELDSILYSLGYSLVLADRQAEAFPYFTRIVRDKPNSKYVPDALLNVAEYLFNSGRMQEAEQFYTEVEAFPKSHAYGLAIYKKGWCYFNMGMHEEAMNQFLKVIEFAKTEDAKATGYAHQLLREAQRDMVLVYSQRGNPDNAIEVFKKITPQNYMELAIRLAEAYTGAGEYEKSTRLYKKIIGEFKGSDKEYRVVEFQRGILLNAYKLAVKAKVVEETRRLIALLDKFKDSAPKDYITAQLAEAEELVRVIATEYHKEAAKTEEEVTKEFTHHLYNEYLRLFPNSPFRKDILMNYAVLLEQLRKYEEAAQRFTEIAESGGDPEIVLKAAHGAVRAYYALVESQPKKSAKGEETTDTEPKEIPEFEKKLITACERYIKIAPPNAEDLVNARFAAAKAYYDYNHFKEAIEGFSYIIENAPDHENAPAAAHLLLSSYHLIRDIKALNETAEKISRMPQLLKGEVPTIVHNIKQQADFNKCYEFEKIGRYTTAAECFLGYIKKFPNTPLKDKAMIAAGANYFKARNVNAALEVNAKIFEEMPDSPIAPRALFNIAEIYRRLAVYSEAAKYYEMFVQLLPKHELVEEALRYGTIFRSGLNEYEMAIKDMTRYLELFPKVQHAPRVFLEIGIQLEKQGKYPQAQKHFEQYISRYGKAGGIDLYLLANLKIAQTLKAQKKDDLAEKQYKRTVQSYVDLPDDEKTKVTAVGLAAVAEARFMEGEMILERVRKIKLVGGTEKQIQEQINKKLPLIKEAIDIFATVEAFQQPNWTIAAYSRMGFGMQELAMAIEAVPPPPGLTEDQKAFFKDGLAEKARPIWDKAMEHFRTCVETAKKLKWFNKYSEEAEDALMKRDPEFRALPDIRPSATFYTLNKGKPTFIKETEEAEPPRWSDSDLEKRVKTNAEGGKANAEAIYNLGAYLEGIGDLKGAKEKYEKALQINPNLAIAEGRLGIIAISMGNPSEASLHFERAIKIDKANAVVHNQEAAKALLARNYIEAINHARMALVSEPENMDSYQILAATYLEMGLKEAAILVCHNALGIDPKDANIQNMLGIIFMKMGEVRQAVNMFEQAVANDPNLFDARMNLGAITLAYKDFHTAAEQFEKALSLKPTNTQAQMALATSYKGLGKGEEAKKLLLEVVKREPPNFADVHFNLCILYQEAFDDDEKALEECQTFMRLADPSHPKKKTAEVRIDGIKATIEAKKQVMKEMKPETPKEGTEKKNE